MGWGGDILKGVRRGSEKIGGVGEGAYGWQKGGGRGTLTDIVYGHAAREETTDHVGGNNTPHGRKHNLINVYII